MQLFRVVAFKQTDVVRVRGMTIRKEGGTFSKNLEVTRSTAACYVNNERFKIAPTDFK